MKLLPLMLLVCTLPSAAQSLYKCTLDGKVTYSQTPCERGDATPIAVPDAPRPNPAAAAELKRQEREARKLQGERRKREAREEREELAAARAAGAHKKKCEKLRMQQKWAEEDARGATLPNLERARTKASRAADTYRLECGG